MRFPTQVELYKWCDDLSGESSGMGTGSFHRDSPPYLMATEHPWSRFPGRCLEGAAAMCIAGSGDVPLFMLQAGAAQVVAVDVSRSACSLNELKRAALRLLSYEDFLPFFLGGVTRAFDFLRARGLAGRLPADERRDLYGLLREDLSEPARAFWDDLFSSAPPDGSSPFRSFLHTLDLFSLEGIPYLQNPALYEAWQAGARDYPILNLPLDSALLRLDMAFDVIYVSNVPEYMKMHFLMEENPEGYRSWLDDLMGAVIKRLNPAGMFCAYFFQSVEGPTLASDLEDFAPLREGGMDPALHQIEYVSEALRSRFRNVLAVWEKPRA